MMIRKTRVDVINRVGNRDDKIQQIDGALRKHLWTLFCCAIGGSFQMWVVKKDTWVLLP